MKRPLAAILTCLILASCGGGGGGAAPEEPPPTAPVPADPPPADPDPAAFNAGLGGHIVYDRADGTSVIDLASGQVVATSTLLGVRPVSGVDEFVAYDTARRYSAGEDDLITLRRDTGSDRFSRGPEIPARNAEGFS